MPDDEFVDKFVDAFGRDLLPYIEGLDVRAIVGAVMYLHVGRRALTDIEGRVPGDQELVEWLAMTDPRFLFHFSGLLHLQEAQARRLAELAIDEAEAIVRSS